MDEQQKQILRQVADNPALTEALKALLKSKFEPEITRANDTITDNQLGQIFRAKLVGLHIIDEAFKEIARCKTHSNEPVKINPAI